MTRVPLPALFRWVRTDGRSPGESPDELQQLGWRIVYAHEWHPVVLMAREAVST